MAMVSIFITCKFDEHIAKITTEDVFGGSFEWTTSGTESSEIMASSLTFNVTLAEGYILDTVTTNNEYNMLYDIGTDNFSMACDDDGYATLTLTSKSTTSSTQKSVDLSTLYGWASLSDGTHTLTIKAKASGYADSEASTSVEFKKGGS